MRRTVVGNVPVDSATVAFALRAAKPPHIAKVVVRPHYRRALWNLQPGVENRQHLLVWNKKLWRTIRQHGALRGKNLFKNLDLLFGRLAVLHLPIVNPPHPNSPENFQLSQHILCALCVLCGKKSINALFPIFNEKLAVTDPAPFLLVLLGQIAVVAQHRLAMRRANSNSLLRGKRKILGTRGKLISTFMHRRPNKIKAFLLHEREYLAICPRAYLFFFPKVLHSPRPQAPVFVVHKNATILNPLASAYARQRNNRRNYRNRRFHGNSITPFCGQYTISCHHSYTPMG